MDRDLILSGPGSPGYILVENATVEEIKHYSESNISQGKKMLRKGLRLKRYAHKRIETS